MHGFVVFVRFFTKLSNVCIVKLCDIALLSGETENHLMTFDNISSWFSTSQLRSAVLTAVSELKSAIQGSLCDIVNSFRVH